MQKFLISIMLAWGLSVAIFFLYATKNAGENLISDFIFAFLLFLALSFTLSLVFYALRIFLARLFQRKKIKWEDEEKDLRPLWRASFRISLAVSFFVSFVAFLKLEEQLNVFNLVILAAIIIVAMIWLRGVR
ncbi:hypothetical protein A2Z23_00170 [Candidatus Curtissbacteria bacterium RBG_16_39_7]|uniref:Uncharacterized protein n=1 Tax=Candidatus Curtissbacteria bacterium RBG_16_39_7 TaxID=1797707 RepID=A0A1F5G3A3_9BACT|nr:MAG: hypothetical protein A2Z23_00170 [Candidatus Curtissbacteria bacterium RBG_16_39_7]